MFGLVEQSQKTCNYFFFNSPSVNIYKQHVGQIHAAADQNAAVNCSTENPSKHRDKGEKAPSPPKKMKKDSYRNKKLCREKKTCNIILKPH